jgi:hypothetical protein
MDQHDLEGGTSPEERVQLAVVSERLERDRPVPRAVFRGDLRRRLLRGRRGQSEATVAPARWRILVATYSGLGALLLAVAAIGLAGAGPFAS